MTVPHHLGVLTLYTPEIATMHEMTRSSKTIFCERWGHDYVECDHKLDPERPASWSKISFIKKHLANYDWIMWIDADALVMNPEINVDDLLDDSHDFVVAKARKKDPFGNNNINLGVFFIRNTPWAHELLDRIYALDEFIEHICWEQAAFCHLYETDASVREKVRIDLDNNRFNSFSPDYRKGDFVFHAVEPRRMAHAKEDLVARILAEDKVIAFAKEPDIQILAMLGQDTDALVVEYTLTSLAMEGCRKKTSPVQIISLRDEGFAAQGGHSAIHSLWFQAVREALRMKPEGLFLIANQPLQFTSSWERSLLVNLADADLLFPDTTGKPDLRMLFLRNSSRMEQLLIELETLHNGISNEIRNRKDSLEILFAAQILTLASRLGLKARPFDTRHFSDSRKSPGFAAINLKIEMPVLHLSTKNISLHFANSRDQRTKFMEHIESYLTNKKPADSPVSS